MARAAGERNIVVSPIARFSIEPTGDNGLVLGIGGVKPPREFVLMDRAAVGLGSVFLRLKAELNWHRELAGLISDFDPAALGRRQAKLLKAQGLAPPA